MKKLHLNLDDLNVDSFEASQPSDVTGTVVGQASLNYDCVNDSWQIECAYETSCIGGAVICEPDPIIFQEDGDDGTNGGFDPADPFSPEANDDPIW